jgi:hypothetical protein
VRKLHRLVAAFAAATVAVLGVLAGWALPALAQAPAATSAPPTTAPPATTTTTAAPTAGDTDGPLVIKVSTYLMALGKPDISSGVYTADFYLVMRCNRKCDPSGFEVRNGKITFVDKQDETPTSRVFRVNANLTAPLELHRYPFDQHKLTIELEDRLRPVSELVYKSDSKSNGIDPTVLVPGWELRREKTTASISVHHYPVFDAPFDDYSLYTFEIEIGRAPLAAFMKVLFPALAIMSTAFLGMFLKPDKAVQRLGIHTGALTASILFHLNVTSGIPPSGYLVDADKFMLANYAGLVAAVLSTVLMMIRFDSGVEERARRVYRVGLLAVPLVWLVGQSIVWLSR